MPLKYRDAGSSTLEFSINATATSIKPVSVSSFPNPTRGDFSANNNDFFFITLAKGSGETEVLKVTDILANTGNFIVSRGYGSGIANSFQSGDTIQLRMGSSILGEHVANTYLTKNYDSNANTVSNTYFNAYLANAFSGTLVTNTHLKAIGFASNTYAASNTYVQRYLEKANATVYMEKANTTVFLEKANASVYLAVANVSSYAFTSNAYAASNTYVNDTFATKAYAASNAYVNGFAGGTIVSNAYLSSAYTTTQSLETNYYNNSTAVSNSYIASAYLALSGGTLTGALTTGGLLSATGSGTPFEVNSTNSNDQKIRFEDNGTTRGFIVSNATYPFAAYDASANYEFQVDDSGNGEFRGNVTAYASDKRLKTKIETIQDALSKVKSLEGFSYTWNDVAPDDFNKEQENVGVYAQDVEAVLPQVVKQAPFDIDPSTRQSVSGENYLTVQYEMLVPLLIEAIKELSAKVEELENK